ncbi:MAG: hypothetical protein U0441_24675 [Polyangiaceae bacterium]
MRKWHLAAAALAVAAIPTISAGCNAPPLGEIVLIVKTDMAPPKDFNKLRIQVFNEGELKFQYEGPVPGSPDDKARIVLPSTLGLVAPDDPTNTIRIEVGVRSGGKDGPVRVVREVVTTIPSDRVAMLDIPIQFLCKNDDIPFDNDGNLKPSDCAEGQTCIAGVCQDSKVDSTTLPDYDPKSVFGGSSDPAKGICFDVVKCFETAELIDTALLDPGSCSFPIPSKLGYSKLNLALGVESDGICNGVGCFIVLDRVNDSVADELSTGWKLDGPKTHVKLPKGVCKQLDLVGAPNAAPKVLQIVQAPVSDGCPQKDVTYSTCGEWSAIGPGSSVNATPTSIAGAQDHPIAVALLTTSANDTFAYWTNGGNSTIRGASLGGGKVISIDSADPPRDIIATEKALFWTAANGLGSVNMFLAQKPAAGEQLVQLATGLAQPDGLAIFEDATTTKLFWTEFADPGRIFTATMAADGLTFDVNGVQELAQDNAYPARMVADNTYVYWTNEGTFDLNNGSVARIQHAVQGPTKLAFAVDGGAPLAAPRAIALDAEENALYFATIGDGKVWRITNANTATPDPARVFADGLSAPNGIVIYGGNVFIANRGDGTIVYKAKTAAATDPVTPLAANQRNPGALLAKNNFLVWVNEGPSASAAKEGSIVKLDISKL